MKSCLLTKLCPLALGLFPNDVCLHVTKQTCISWRAASLRNTGVEKGMNIGGKSSSGLPFRVHFVFQTLLRLVLDAIFISRSLTENGLSLLLAVLEQSQSL